MSDREPDLIDFAPLFFFLWILMGLMFTQPFAPNGFTGYMNAARELDNLERLP